MRIDDALCQDGVLVVIDWGPAPFENMSWTGPDVHYRLSNRSGHSAKVSSAFDVRSGLTQYLLCQNHEN